MRQYSSATNLAFDNVTDCMFDSTNFSSGSAAVGIMGMKEALVTGLDGATRAIVSIPRVLKSAMKSSVPENQKVGTELVFDEESISASQEKEWKDFLTEIETIQDSNINNFVSAAVPKVRSQLSNELGYYVAPPRVGTAEEGGVVLAWNIGQYYLSVDILTNHSIEWFFKDTNSGKYNGGINGDLAGFPPPQLRVLLSLLKPSFIEE